MTEQQLERSMLDGKDREELHAIAGAMGVRGVTRMRKADLVEAILAAAGANGDAASAANASANGDAAAKPKRVRSRKAPADDPIAALAAEEDALAAASGPTDETEVAPRPVAGRRPSQGASAPAADDAGATAPAAPTNGATATEPGAAPESRGDDDDRDPGSADTSTMPRPDTRPDSRGDARA